MAHSIEQTLRDIAKHIADAVAGAVEAAERAIAGPGRGGIDRPLRKGDPIPVRVTAGKKHR